MNKNDFVDELAKINIDITPLQLEQFNKYFELLVSWNEKINLTAITKEEEVYEKHFYDCLLLSQSIKLSNQSICDIGAGAGFPSIPLKIIFPELKISIVDSLAKRIKFLNILIDELELKNVSTFANRAEDFVVNNRECFDIVTGRAVARLNILDELCLPLVKVDGLFIALKGAKGLEEHEEALEGIKLLGGISKDISCYKLITDQSIRYLLSYQKVSKTNNKYPRHFSQIKKKPL